MTITVTIGGVAMSGDSHFVDEGSVNHTNAIGQRDTFACRIVSKDGSYTPAIGASVSVSDDTGQRFGGTIREKTVSQFGVAVVTEIQCASWEQIMDRRLVGQISSNPGETCGEFFQRIFDAYLGAEGLSATIVATGPVIDPPMSFDWPTVREAFDLIASQASDDTDTYMWDCTPAKVTRFYKQTSFAAPMNVTDSSADVMRPITINQSFGGNGVGYANKAFVRFASFITDPRTNTYHPDGTERSFSFELPIAHVPAITLDGVAQTVGIRDVDTGKQWYWQDGSTEVSQDPSETIPSNTSTLVVTAQGYQSTVVDAGDVPDEVTARSIAEDNSGWYMVLLESSTPGGYADAVSFGQAKLAKYANGVPRAVEYVTTTNGIKAGQHQSISLSGFGESVSSTFIIESVTLFQAGTEYGFKVRAVNGALANGWLQKIRDLANKGGGITSVGGTVINTGSSATPPDNVTIGTVTVEAAQYSPTGAAKGRKMVAKRPISVKYTPPSPAGTFAGVYVEVTLPDDAGTTPSMDGSTGLGTTVSLGATTPAKFGPFPYSETGASVRVTVDEPNWRTTSTSVTGRVRLISYSADVTNDSATSPSTTFTVDPPATAKPGAATAYAQNPTTISIPATFPDGTANPWDETTTGKSRTHLLVHQDPPDDPSFAGVAWRVTDDPDGLEIINASGPQKEADFELVFDTPATVGTYYVWACGVDADGNVNPIVPDITPMATVTLGTTGGTVDLSAATVASMGLGLGSDGTSLNVKITGPLYTDVSGNIDLRIANDFVVSSVGGHPTLSQNAVDLAKSVNFDLSQFDKSSGSLVIKALAVNKLIAGDALFAGDATFARSGGGKVTLNSAGLAIADNNVTPNATVTLTSTGATVAKGTNNVQVTSSGVAINGPSGTLTATSSGVVISNGTSSVTVSASAVTIANGSLTSPTISGGSLSISTFGGTVAISSGTTGLSCTSGSYSSNYSASSFTMAGPLSQSLYIIPGQLNVTSGSSTATLTPIALRIDGLSSSNPGAGSKQFWYDPSDGNRVKFAA